LSGIACVYLQTKEKISAWAFGILSVGISCFIFYHSKLYSDLLLHVVYIFLNIYGWYTWSTRGTEDDNAPILFLSRSGIMISAVTVIILAFGLGYFMGTFTDADLYYFDAFTTAGSLVAQYLLAKKYLQNWLLWIIVDVVAIPVYLYKGLYFFSFLFAVYLVLCVYGLRSWRKTME
ncbi:MAG: nicotinamide riboside transporter PnuC, partial [Bacteroidia bacterium]|nr:nicotinamide riboside transporter PnuC [Bacteroidia bacterium]